MSDTVEIGPLEQKLINALQGGFPLVEQPYREVGDWLGVGEEQVIESLARLKKEKLISRFGPMYNSEKLGGSVTLAALAVPENRFDEVAEKVNAHREVAHNYARDHELNMWFVIASETPEEIDTTIAAIEQETGLTVFNFPKEKEFFIGLRFEV